MKKIITYGTFDLLHQGHINILKRAKELGDYLVVGVTSENYDEQRGKLNVSQSLVDRIENVRNTGLADKIIVEEYMGQKIQDIQKYDIDTFVIGSDWIGKFDYLEEYCNVLYLDRTKGVSSTDLRNSQHNILRIGIVGNGRIAERFVKEARFVSGIDIEFVYGRNEEKLKEFCDKFSLTNYFINYTEFLKNVDAVYIALPHNLHYKFAKEALLNNKHVLCEKPITLNCDETKELYQIAKYNNLIIQEAIKTVYAPCFNRLLDVVKNGIIGNIKDIDATFTKLINNKNSREFDLSSGGGSLTELGSYPICLITKILGANPKKITYTYYKDEDTGVDLMNKVSLLYSGAIATANVGIGIKKEGNCIISGTKGYIYIPAPWWKTEYFEIRFENSNYAKKVYIEFAGDGLRYEIADFLKSVHNCRETYKLTPKESIFINKVINAFRCDDDFNFEKELICIN